MSSPSILTTKYLVHSGWFKLLNSYRTEHLPSLEFDVEEIETRYMDVRSARQYYFDLQSASQNYKLPIEVAGNIDPLTFGSYSLALWTAPDLYTLLKVACEYCIVLGMPLDLQFYESRQGNVEIWFVTNEVGDKDGYVTNRGILLYITTLLTLLRRVCRTELDGIEVQLDSLFSENSASFQAVEKKFSCQFTSGHILRKIIFKRKSMFTSLATSEQDIHRVNMVLLREQMTELSTNNIVLRVRKALDSLDELSLANVNFVSQNMGMTARTLNRKLNEVSTHYRVVLENYKLEKALSLLSKSNLSVSIIAEKLGFSDVTAFSRAFKRWTGCTPSDYR
ncbi:AraC family transcriptional regulator [Vibrio sp. ZSDE26]|uniref:AraC family transcriptional regulator n=1 Tax=Vibrio amylolyticus TaxID=2847292 RepID=A0A9X2BIK6_9VIBR|nr:AraC family transcriptional regulator [Vibrio amylolyticus]MCK6264829.1 AraC family transcriptional regulator [Vibrio amylolyticus]